MPNPNCPQCQGVGKIQKGSIVDGQIVDLTIEECECVQGVVEFLQIDCEDCDCDHGGRGEDGYNIFGVCCSQCCECVSCESYREEVGVSNE
jgi:hypothetical protein